jgi:hypothetical protein
VKVGIAKKIKGKYYLMGWHFDGEESFTAEELCRISEAHWAVNGLPRKYTDEAVVKWSDFILGSAPVVLKQLFAIARLAN